jgi:hypothetical protein
MPIPRKLDDVLDIGANSFESLRYTELYPQASFFLTDFPHALMEVILMMKPEWSAECRFLVPKPNDGRCRARACTT